MRKTYINWDNGTAEELRDLHRSEDDRITARRLFGMIKLSEGRSVKEVSGIMEVSESSVQRWIKSFNEFGIEGLLARGEQGRKKSITVEEFNRVVLPLLKDDTDHWSVVRIHSTLSEKGLISASYSTLLRSVHENGYSLVVSRPTNPNSDPKKRQHFLETLKDIEQDPEKVIYFCDEAGFEGDPRPRRKWVKRGTTPTSPRTGSHVRASVIGAINPKEGELFSLIVPQTDTDVFQLFIDEFAKATTDTLIQGKQVILILDNASWHKSPRLNWHHVTPVYLPPYSPDLNPIEQLWREIKSNWMPHFFTRSYEKLLDKLVEILKMLTELPHVLSSVASYSHLL